MTVGELIRELMKRPDRNAPVYVWDTKESFTEVRQVSYPAGPTLPNVFHSRRPLPEGAIVVWGDLDAKPLPETSPI